MRMVYLVCCIHLWWGISLIFGMPLSRPFGALEPFFLLPYANDFTVGILLTVCGALPLTEKIWTRFWCISCLMVPQQIILSWGFVLGAIEFFITHNERAWFALGYTTVLFFFHAKDLRDEFVYEIIERGERKRVNGGQ